VARDVTQEAFATASTDGALVVDVREADEYAAGRAPGAWLMSLRTVPARELPAVAGGTGARARDGRPLVAGSHRTAA
jgi:rhodanese-related sulfurtransferase